jgi:hypothetical protein
MRWSSAVSAAVRLSVCAVLSSSACRGDAARYEVSRRVSLASSLASRDKGLPVGGGPGRRARRIASTARRWRPQAQVNDQLNHSPGRPEAKPHWNYSRRASAIVLRPLQRVHRIGIDPVPWHPPLQLRFTPARTLLMRCGSLPLPWQCEHTTRVPPAPWHSGHDFMTGAWRRVGLGYCRTTRMPLSCGPVRALSMTMNPSSFIVVMYVRMTVSRSRSRTRFTSTGKPGLRRVTSTPHSCWWNSTVSRSRLATVRCYGGHLISYIGRTASATYAVPLITSQAT